MNGQAGGGYAQQIFSNLIESQKCKCHSGLIPMFPHLDHFFLKLEPMFPHSKGWGLGLILRKALEMWEHKAVGT